MHYIQQNTLTLRHEISITLPLKQVSSGRRKVLITVNESIKHEGVVVRVDGQSVTVQFVQHSACSGCHAKALCSGGTSESAERRVVANSYGVPYQVGEKVNVIVGSGMAWSAVVIAFIVPMAIAFVCLFLVVGQTGSELAGALATLGILGVYYCVVWTQRNHLERRVEFTLERKINTL